MVIKSEPLTKATGMGRLPELLAEAAGPRAVEQAFHAARLPLRLIDERSHRVPLRALITLFEDAAHRAADPTFGLRVGMDGKLGSYGVWARYGTAAPTLREGIARLAHSAALHQTGTGFHLEDHGETAVWRYVTPSFGSVNLAQHSDHVVPAMIAFAAAFVGDDFTPAAVETNYQRPNHSTTLDDAFGCPWYFGGSGVSICFQSALLDQAKQTQNEEQLKPLDQAAIFAMENTSEVLLAIESRIALMLLDGRPDVAGLAKSFGVSVRSLQREFHSLGTSFSALLDQVLAKRALTLLVDTALPIHAIGERLGYAEPANFTRAVRRWTARPPSALRGQDFEIAARRIAT